LPINQSVICTLKVRVRGKKYFEMKSDVPKTLQIFKKHIFRDCVYFFFCSAKERDFRLFTLQCVRRDVLVVYDSFRKYSFSTGIFRIQYFYFTKTRTEHCLVLVSPSGHLSFSSGEWLIVSSACLDNV